MIENVPTPVVSIVIPIVIAWLSVRFAFARYKQERWWDRKVLAYERIIGALYTYRKFYEAHLGESEGGQEVLENEKSQLREKSIKAKNDLEFTMDTSALLLPEKVVSKLCQLKSGLNEIEYQTDWHKHLEVHWTLITVCIDDVIGCARLDLGINRTWTKELLNILRRRHC